MAVKANKYRAKRTKVDGISFHSKLEADRWCILRQFEKTGEITHLERQPRFALTINGVDCGTYLADFRFFTRPTNTTRGEFVVEDCKGFKTDIYKLKKKLVEAIYPGVKIVEVTKANADVCGWRERKVAA
jgi:hypothetical protein